MNFIAKVEEGQKPNIREIARSLEGMGIRVRRVMQLTGTITGDSGSLTLGQVKIKGIQSVAPDRAVRKK
ncbi:hypothetical protein [Puia dinghuensis]|uniref:Uncharacterized protein n=1 Tax=Puia dinghuensis TaxID=1792502 RepID=A0A8J2UJ19_9BACT|nr:hypothetical protein [Puia dinghuensis]GGB23102.1 hypothetical protein GCM10011511_53790 [Puia dinghuensis]